MSRTIPPRTLFGLPLGMGLIVLDKLVRGVALLVLAAILLTLRARGLTDPFQILFARELAEDPRDLLANLVIGLVPSLSTRVELWLAIGAVLYAVLEAVEAWGLWRGVLWVEVFIIVEMTALLPYELWELLHHATAFKIVSIIINAIIVWYLANLFLRKRQAHLAQRTSADKM